MNLVEVVGRRNLEGDGKEIQTLMYRDTLYLGVNYQGEISFNVLGTFIALVNIKVLYYFLDWLAFLF